MPKGEECDCWAGIQLVELSHGKELVGKESKNNDGLAT